MMAHLHCNSCIIVACKRQDDGCPVENCPNGCGITLHRCKIEEHLGNTCPESRVPCINAQYGCEEVLRRKHTIKHIEHCPASTVMCRFSHDRLTAYFLGPKVAGSEQPLLDEKFLLGDLDVLRTRVVSCNDDFSFGDTSYGSNSEDESGHSDPNRPTSNCDLNIQCTVGILTNATVASEYHSKSLKPRESICLKMPARFRHHYTKKVKTRSRHCYSFPCNEIVRRDEFATHWKSLHLDIQVGMSRIVERCPMYSYGCMHGETRLAPNPPGSSIDYHHETNFFLLKSPEALTTEPPLQSNSGDYSAEIQIQQELALYGYGEDSEESLDVLGQLPAEILMTICQSLDSMSLWNLSRVNWYLRKVCFNVVKKRGVVYHKWIFDEMTTGWVLGIKVHDNSVHNDCVVSSAYGILRDALLYMPKYGCSADVYIYLLLAQCGFIITLTGCFPNCLV